jgi:hypothetical protein
MCDEQKCILYREPALWVAINQSSYTEAQICRCTVTGAKRQQRKRLSPRGLVNICVI